MNEYVDVVEWLDSMGYACFDCECRARKELRATPMGICPNTKLRPIGGAGAGAGARSARAMVEWLANRSFDLSDRNFGLRPTGASGRSRMLTWWLDFLCTPRSAWTYTAQRASSSTQRGSRGRNGSPSRLRDWE